MKPYQPFGGRQGGGGAPNRTESGKVAAGFRTDPELRFPRHASKAHVEPILVSTAVPQIYFNPPSALKFIFWTIPSGDDIPIYKHFEILLVSQ